jgi:protein gp37
MSVRRSGVGYADFSGGDANFIIGCTSVSAGCAHCYARDLIENRQGRDFSEVRLYPDKLKRLATARFEEKGTPFRRGPGSRPIIFPIDLSDFFHEAVPDEFRLQAIEVMASRSDADWLILTKRAGEMLVFSNRYFAAGWPSNLWPGVTVENNATLWRASVLLAVRAKTRWISLEPMLESISLENLLGVWTDGAAYQPRPHDKIDLTKPHAGLPRYAHLYTAAAKPKGAFLIKRQLAWVVLGAESGPKRRPFDLDGARSVRDQCQAAGVPFFYKQGSHRFPGRNDVLDGQKWKQFPH